MGASGLALEASLLGRYPAVDMRPAETRQPTHADRSISVAAQAPGTVARPTGRRRGAWGRWWLAVALAAAIVLGLGWLIPDRPPDNDALSYLAMADDPFGGSRRAGWHGYRVLAPLVVHLLPVPHELGFRLLSAASLVTAASLLWLGARWLPLSEDRALLVVPLFLTSWAGIGNLWDPFQVDPLAWVFVALAWLGLLARRLPLVAISALIGTAAKEVVALVAAAGLVVFWEKGRPQRALAMAVWLAAPPLAVLVGLRLLIVESPSDLSDYAYKWLLVVQELGPARYLFYAFASYGALWLMAARAWLAAAAWWRGPALAVALVGLPLGLVGTPERMLEFVFPAVVSAGAIGLARLPRLAALAFLVGNACFVLRVATGVVPAALGWSGLALALALTCWTWWTPAGRLSA